VSDEGVVAFWWGNDDDVLMMQSDNGDSGRDVDGGVMLGRQ
jgi:hypothetical protein